jgi:hypothetical protein
LQLASVVDATNVNHSSPIPTIRVLQYKVIVQMASETESHGFGWALDNADVSVSVKPRRPYTPYNIFYLLERELMVQEPGKSNARKSLAASSSANDVVSPEDELDFPTRYKGIVMAPRWYDPNLKEKRKHRRTHGKVST